MSDYKNLQVWQKAHALAIRAYRTAMGIRASRYAALRSQIIRAAMSIPANIVEGRRQDSERNFALAAKAQSSLLQSCRKKNGTSKLVPF
jgi:four helix bundle protein